MKNQKVLSLVQSALIAALYVALTYLANALGLANMAIQVRFSEALTILPFFTFAAVPGLFIGCLLANILTGCILTDVIAGSLTTLVAAVLTYLLRRIGYYNTPATKVPLYRKILATLPPIVLNAITVPFVLTYAYEIPGSFWFFVLTVAIGEIISCGILGLILLFSIQKREYSIFGPETENK